MTKLEELRAEAYEQACQHTMDVDGYDLEGAKKEVDSDNPLSSPKEVEGLYMLGWDEASCLLSWYDDADDLTEKERTEKPLIRVRSGSYGNDLIYFFIIGTDLDLVRAFGDYASLRLYGRSIDEDTVGEWLNVWLTAKEGYDNAKKTLCGFFYGNKGNDQA